MFKELIRGSIFKKVLNLKNNSKTAVIASNVIYSAFIKLLTVGLSFLSVPILIGYLNSEQYGVWLTILTFTSWFTLFDLGLGNGLKNKLVEFTATGKPNQARIYVSTTFFVMGSLCIGISLIITIISPFIEWQKIYNVSEKLRSSVTWATVIILVSTLLNMVLKLIYNLLHAYQQSFKVDLINFLCQLISVLALLVAKHLTEPSLIIVATVFAISQFGILLIVNIYLFGLNFNMFSPSMKLYDIKLFKEVANVSGQFFLIQFAGLIMYMTDNFIIANLLGPNDVTKYNVGLKYFSILPMLWGLVLTPLWPMVTKAYYTTDMQWLKKIFNSFLTLWGLNVLVGSIILIFANSFYQIWVGNAVKIPLSLNICIYIYTSISIFATLMATFINGIGKIKMQAYLTLFCAVINIPLAIIFCRSMHFGLVGIPYATSVCLLISAFFAFIQSRKIINATAKGLWNQ